MTAGTVAVLAFLAIGGFLVVAFVALEAYRARALRDALDEAEDGSSAERRDLWGS